MRQRGYSNAGGNPPPTSNRGGFGQLNSYGGGQTRGNNQGSQPNSYGNRQGYVNQGQSNSYGSGNQAQPNSYGGGQFRGGQQNSYGNQEGQSFRGNNQNRGARGGRGGKPRRKRGMTLADVDYSKVHGGYRAFYMGASARPGHPLYIPLRDEEGNLVRPYYWPPDYQPEEKYWPILKETREKQKKLGLVEPVQEAPIQPQQVQEAPTEKDVESRPTKVVLETILEEKNLEPALENLHLSSQPSFVPSEMPKSTVRSEVSPIAPSSNMFDEDDSFDQVEPAGDAPKPKDVGQQNGAVGKQRKFSFKMYFTADPQIDIHSDDRGRFVMIQSDEPLML